MMHRTTWMLPLSLVTALMAGCKGSGDADAELEGTLAARQARLEQALSDPTNAQPNAPVARWILPDKLAELSGLALTGDDRLFTHGDELGTVFEIDYRRGEIVKEFSLGPPVVHDDFEAITVVRDTIILLTAQGFLYRFAEGKDGAGVAYSTIDTKLGERCEFEGIAFDSAANSLVLACKNVRDGGLNDALVLYKWPLGNDSTATGLAPAEIRVPLSAMDASLGWTKIEPSDIAVDRRTGNYVIVASGQKALIEITPLGEVVSSRALPSGHAQPEGLAITRDNLMLLSDEANQGPAVITAYRRQE
jgi:uncharacterized protein YjiK